MLKDVHAGRYIHGVAVHWYMDGFVPAEISLEATHHLYPEYYLFGTEACAGWSPADRGVKLGSWDRAEQYAHDILEVRRSHLGMRVTLAAVADVRFSCQWLHKGESPSFTLQCRFTSCSVPHTLSSNCLQATKAKRSWCFLCSSFTLPPIYLFCMAAFRI